MSRKRITACPVCQAGLETTELTCGACGTRLSGRFPAPPLARLSPEHQVFIETFVRCRGVIRDVERALNVSYPTVRARLDAAVDALETVLTEEEASASEERRAQARRTILKRVEEGKLSPEDAAKKLQRL